MRGRTKCTPPVKLEWVFKIMINYLQEKNKWFCLSYVQWKEYREVEF